MKVKIARQKAGAVHFAKRVSPNGFVSEWVSDESQCVPVGEELAEVVAAFYAGRVNGGTILFATEDGKPARKPVHGKEGDPPAIAAPVTVPSEDAREYRKQAVVLGEELEAANKEIDRVTAERDEFFAQASSANDTIDALRLGNADVCKARSALEIEIAGLKAEIATLTTKNVELEALLKTAP